ncbi:MAG: hypothetical protein ACYCZR_12405 [Burkholderiales bacterium]
MKDARIYRQPLRSDKDYAYPWFYEVEHDPPEEDASDYGSVQTWQQALACVNEALAEREVTR